MGESRALLGASISMSAGERTMYVLQIMRQNNRFSKSYSIKSDWWGVPGIPLHHPSPSWKEHVIDINPNERHRHKAKCLKKVNWPSKENREEKNKNELLAFLVKSSFRASRHAEGPQYKIAAI